MRPSPVGLAYAGLLAGIVGRLEIADDFGKLSRYS